MVKQYLIQRHNFAQSDFTFICIRINKVCLISALGDLDYYEEFRETLMALPLDPLYIITFYSPRAPRSLFLLFQREGNKVRHFPTPPPTLLPHAEPGVKEGRRPVSHKAHPFSNSSFLQSSKIRKTVNYIVLPLALHRGPPVAKK